HLAARRRAVHLDRRAAVHHVSTATKGRRRMVDGKKQEKAARRGRAGETGRAMWGAFAAAALAVGAAGGWVARGASPRAALGSTRPAASTPAGAAASCEEWSSEICTRLGATSEGCTKAKAAAEVL